MSANPQHYAGPLALQAEQCFEATARVVARHNAEHPAERTTIDDELVTVLRHYRREGSSQADVYEAALSLSRHLAELNPNRSDKDRNAEIQRFQRPTYRSRGDDLGLPM